MLIFQMPLVIFDGNQAVADIDIYHINIYTLTINIKLLTSRGTLIMIVISRAGTAITLHI